MKSISEINIGSIEGKLLMAALAIITTESRTNEEPDQVLKSVVELSKTMFEKEVEHEKLYPNSSHIARTKYLAGKEIIEAFIELQKWKRLKYLIREGYKK